MVPSPPPGIRGRGHHGHLHARMRVRAADPHARSADVCPRRGGERAVRQHAMRITYVWIDLGTEGARKNAEELVTQRNKRTRKVPTPIGIVCRLKKKSVTLLLVTHPVPVAWAQSLVGDEKSSRDIPVKKQRLNKTGGTESQERANAELKGVDRARKGTGDAAEEMEAAAVEAVGVTTGLPDADAGAEDSRGDATHRRHAPTPVVATLMDEKGVMLMEEKGDVESAERFSD